MTSHRKNPEDYNPYDDHDNKPSDSYMNNTDIQRWKLSVYIKSEKPD